MNGLQLIEDHKEILTDAKIAQIIKEKSPRLKYMASNIEKSLLILTLSSILL